MEHTIINPELVEQITTLVQAWTVADRRLRDLFHGWEQLATRAGLERGFHLQLAKLPGVDALTGGEIDDMEEAGRVIHEAYSRGTVRSAMDLMG